MSWFDWVPTLITGASAIYGDLTKTAANNQASQISQQATQTATQQALAGLTQSEGSYDASKTNDQALQTQSAPGVANQQTAIAQQNQITPAQQLALDEARRSTITGLNSSDLRGSGRATVAAVKNVDSTMQANDLAANRARADQAGSALSSQYFNAGQNINQQNTNIASAQQKAGQVAGAGTLDVGQTQAGNVTGNAGIDASAAKEISGSVQAPVSGQAINDIGSQIAASVKRAQSSYNNPVSGQGSL